MSHDCYTLPRAHSDLLMAVPEPKTHVLKQVCGLAQCAHQGMLGFLGGVMDLENC